MQRGPWEGNGIASRPFLHASKVIATLSKNTKEKKIQPSFADTTAKQVVQNHKGAGEKNPYLVILCSYSLKNCLGTNAAKYTPFSL